MLKKKEGKTQLAKKKIAKKWNSHLLRQLTASYGNWEGGENTTGKQEKTKIVKWIIKRGVKKIEMLECWKDWMGERYHIVKCSK